MKLKSVFGALIAVGAMALMAVGVQAATTFSAGAVKSEAGSNVIVPVLVAADQGTTDTVNGYIMRVKYDPTKVTPVKSATADATQADCYATAGTGDFANGVLVADITSTSDTENVLTVAWANATPVTVSDVDSVMSSVEFAVAESATGSIPVNVEVTALTKDGQTMADGTTYTAVAGQIDLSNIKGLLGDVNNDGVIDGTDVTLLKQYVNGIITNLEELYPGADYRGNVNEDATIDGTDVTLLKQFVNGIITSFK